LPSISARNGCRAVAYRAALHSGILRSNPMPVIPTPTVAKGASEAERLAITTIRTLCMDAVQQANSGHPGSPMGLAPTACVLWPRFLRFDPADPIWGNRDRFVLSAGHCSTLLYALLHLTGARAVNPKYEVLGEASVKLDDLKHFRQLDS